MDTCQPARHSQERDQLLGKRRRERQAIAFYDEQYITGNQCIDWYEQKKNNLGIITFIQHVISDDYAAVNAGGVTFSQIHGNAFGDINGDGIIDLVAGKRYWAHLDTYLDPDPHGPPVVYYYRTVHNPKAPGGAEFVPELVHNRSGAGSDMLIIDLNKDNKPNIISSTDRGTFIFWNKGK